MMDDAMRVIISELHIENDELRAEVERLKVAAEAAATMTTTNAGEEIERLRKRVAELESKLEKARVAVRDLTLDFAGKVPGYVQQGYAACEADVGAWLPVESGGWSDECEEVFDGLAAKLARGEHRGAATRKGGG